MHWVSCFDFLFGSCFVALTTFPHCQHISFLLLLYLFRLHFNEPDRIIHFSFMRVPCCARSSFNKRKRRKPRKNESFFLNCHHTHPQRVCNTNPNRGMRFVALFFPLSLYFFRCYSFFATLINGSIRVWPFYDPLCDPVPEPLASNR